MKMYSTHHPNTTAITVYLNEELDNMSTCYVKIFTH